MITILQKHVQQLITFFYPPFGRLMSRQLFSYAFCGSIATGIDIVIFFITYNFWLHKSNVFLYGYTFKATTASVMVAFCVSFPIGFFLQKYVTFTNSALRGRVQLLRYISIVAICILMNIYIIQFLVEQLHIYPTIAKIITTVVVVTFSYFTQKYFSFKEVKSVQR